MTPERQKGLVYYRCHTDACPTTCVREETLEAAISAVLTGVQLTDQQIERTVAWVDERLAAKDRQTAVQAARLQLGQIEQRLGRLTDALVDGVIDRDAYEQRKQSLFLDRARLEQTVAESSDVSDAERVRGILELAKSLARSYEMSDPVERRRIAEMATSNRTVSLKNVIVEPADWLLAAENASDVLDGGHQQPTTRRSHPDHDGKIEQLIRAAQAASVADALHGPDLRG